MGKHSIRGVLTGQELNVVRNYSDTYIPRHAQGFFRPPVNKPCRSNVIPLRPNLSLEDLAILSANLVAESRDILNCTCEWEGPVQIWSEECRVHG